MAAERARTPVWRHNELRDWTLTDETFGLLEDLGFYFAEVLRKRHECLRWTWVRSPKGHRDYHHPVVIPFRGGCWLFPWRIMILVGFGIKEGRSAVDDMRRAFESWDWMVDCEAVVKGCA